MKNSLLLLTLAIGWLSIPTMAQTAQHTDPSAALEVDSTSKGFLPPRLTTEERNAIPEPAMGLIIYNTSKNLLEYYNGTFWGGLGGTPTNTGISFMAKKGLTQGISTGNKVYWETQYNQGGGFDDATDSFIAPEEGTYFLFVDATSDISTTGVDGVYLNFYLNDSSTRYVVYSSSNGTSLQKAYGSAILYLYAGDIVDVRAFQFSYVYGNTINTQSRFGGFLLSRE